MDPKQTGLDFSIYNHFCIRDTFENLKKVMNGTSPLFVHRAKSYIHYQGIHRHAKARPPIATLKLKI